MNRAVVLTLAGAMVVFAGLTLTRRVDRGHSAVPERPLLGMERERITLFWSRYRSATAHRIAGRLEEAEAAYQEALWLDDRHEDAWYYLGSVRFARGDFEGAERAWHQLVEISPRSGRAHAQLGVLYACPDRPAFFRPARAVAALEQARAINPEETGPFLRLGLLAVVRGDIAAASHWLDEVLRTNAGSVEAHFFRGYLAWRAGNVDAAVAHLDAAIASSRPRMPPEGVIGEGDRRPGEGGWRPDTRCPSLDRALAPLAGMERASARADSVYRPLAAGLP